jgi:hypothetical protein
VRLCPEALTKDDFTPQELAAECERRVTTSKIITHPEMPDKRKYNLHWPAEYV